MATDKENDLHAMSPQRLATLALNNPNAILDEIASIAGDVNTDETIGDFQERLESILWFASRGALGKNWGY